MAAEASGSSRAALLVGLSVAESREALSRAAPRPVAADAFLFRQGEPARALYLVEAGRFRLGQVTAEGQEVVLRFAGPGEAMAAIAVLDEQAYPFSAQATEPSRVRSWDRALLRDLFRRVPAFEANVLRVVGSHTRDALDRFRELATEPVPQRLARALLRLVDKEAEAAEGGLRLDRITQRDLAGLCATTLYTVSRTLSQWQAAGLVRTRRGSVLVLSTAGLKRIAEAPGPSDVPRR